MIGDLIRLRPVTVDDAKTFFDSLNDADVNRLTGTTESFSFGQVQAHYSRVALANDRLDYAIIPNGKDDLIGEVVLNNIDEHNRSASFRIALLGAKHFGKGYGTEATSLIVNYGFEVLDLHRIELEVYDFNPRAIHVYRKIGFQQEGIRRDVLFWEGQFHSAIMMSMLKTEYTLLSM